MNELKYQIVSDGSCDLSPELVERWNIKVVPFYVSFDGENYKKEIVEVPIREFYQKMVDNKKLYPKSSLPSVEDFVKAFEPIAKQNIPIICICITTKFSGSLNSANNAKNIIQDKYPDAKITVIDSMLDTVLQGLYVIEAAKMQEAGWSYEDTVTKLEEIKLTGRIIFTTASMDYLQKGGRIGKLTGLLSSTLRIQPLIILKEGEIFPSGITRNRKKALKCLIELAKKHFEEIKESPDKYSFAVGYGYDYREAEEFRTQLLESLGEYSNIKEIPIFQIGATIGVHTGPHPLGMGLIRRFDV